jgi:2-oxoglutarate ferredoxin oxidoreductase subunit beta
VVHDEHRDDPSFAFALSRLSDQDLSHTVTGIFRNIDRPTYDDGARQQVRDAKASRPADLGTLLRGKDTWTVAAE